MRTESPIFEPWDKSWDKGQIQTGFEPLYRNGYMYNIRDKPFTLLYIL